MCVCSLAVFDWNNTNIHLAQAANCGSNIVAIGTGPDAVPEANGDCALPSGSARTASDRLGLATAMVVMGALMFL